MKSRKKHIDDKYDSYVEHPRYGRRPRFTGLNPNPYDLEVQLHSNATNIHELQRRAVQVFGKKLDYINEFIIMQALFTLKWAGNQGVRVDFVSSNQRTP